MLKNLLKRARWIVPCNSNLFSPTTWIKSSPLAECKPENIKMRVHGLMFSNMLSLRLPSHPTINYTQLETASHGEELPSAWDATELGEQMAISTAEFVLFSLLSQALRRRRSWMENNKNMITSF